MRQTSTLSPQKCVAVKMSPLKCNFNFFDHFPSIIKIIIIANSALNFKIDSFIKDSISLHSYLYGFDNMPAYNHNRNPELKITEKCTIKGHKGNIYFVVPLLVFIIQQHYLVVNN